MLLAVMFAFVVIFCILGICDVLFMFKLFLVSPENKRNEFIFLSLDKCDYKFQMYSALQKKNWYGGLYCNGIVALTDDLTDDEINECKKTFRTDDIIFCKSIEEINEKELFGEEKDAGI